jgi:DNA-binding response OmpR family regulator
MQSKIDWRAASCMGNPNEKAIILLVDDDEIVLDVGSLMLQKLGYKVLQATNGMQAIKVFKDCVDDICLVIIDEKLPDKLGTDICKRLKEFEPDVKVLHTSGLGKSLGLDSLECGCETFLPKPFRVKELSNKLRDLLEYIKE